jgi:hypothetical protein
MNKRYQVYIASKTKHAEMWKNLKAKLAAGQSFEINSTWIDEAGPGQSPDLADLAGRCIDEACAANLVIVYYEEGDSFMKGALVEMGAALALGRWVCLVGDPPIKGSYFSHHPKVFSASNVQLALLQFLTFREK